MYKLELAYMHAAYKLHITFMTYEYWPVYSCNKRGIHFSKQTNEFSNSVEMILKFIIVLYALIHRNWWLGHITDYKVHILKQINRTMIKRFMEQMNAMSSQVSMNDLRDLGHA